MPIRYRLTAGHTAGDWRSGESLNFSSAGLLFTSASTLSAGQEIEVLIDWPARLENRIALRLAVRGVIVRSTGSHAAMRFEHYEFRLRRDLAAQSAAAGSQHSPDWHASPAHS